METKKQFQWYIPLQKNTLQDVEYSLNEDGTLDIEGIASTNTKDLQGDVMLPSAIDSMKKQILAMGKNLHGDHKPFLFDGLLGAVNKVYETDNDQLRIGATVLSKYAQDVKEMLDIGVNLGFSVGGAMKEYTLNKSNGFDISDVYLSEVSLTAIPANVETLGTVKTQKGLIESNCLGGICHELTKELKKTREEEINMPEEQQNNEETTTQETDLKSEIKDIVDELWAEKQQGIVDAVVKEVRSEVKSLVQEALKPEENEKENSEEEKEVEKSFNVEDLGPVIAKSVSDAMTDFKKQFFKDIDNNRNPHSDVDMQKQEDLLKQKEQEHPQVTKTYTTQQTAEILMKKQRSINPVVATALKQL